jgi:uncharacterized membrane protein
MELVNKVIGIVIGFIVVFYLVSALAPTLMGAAGNMSASGLPLANLFASNGVILTIFVIFVFVALIYFAMKMKGNK